jgi:hypothetical protein
MITDLGHPAFAAYDVDETIGFYGMLGIDEAFRLHHDDGSLMLVYLHVSGDRRAHRPRACSRPRRQLAGLDAGP